MTIQEALQKAIEGGFLGGPKFAKYRSRSRVVVYEPEDYVKATMSLSETLLRPDFWRALGKTEWNDEWMEQAVAKETDFEGKWIVRMEKLPVWRFYMHRMIDSLADGNTVEEYLNSL